MVWMVVRLIFSFIASAVLGVALMYATMMVAFQLSTRFDILNGIARALESTFGIQAFMVLGTLFYFGLVLTFFEWRKYRYLAQVHRAVGEIAEGRYDRKVPVKNNSEVAEIAVSVNRLVERLLSSMEEERRAEQAKNELITNVSHDLRTPLTSVIGYLGLIEQDRYRDEVELRYYVQIAYAKSQRLNVLIQDLFDYTRLRHEGASLRLEQLNLVELLGQLLEQYRLSMEEVGLQAKLQAEDKRLLIPGDAGKLVRVFENLISNAVKYGSGGTKVDVRLKREAGYAVVDITNDGEPIPEVDLPHIFDRFYRVDKSRTESSGGSGLGLAICKSIVERHNGAIEALSRNGETTFRVRLPVVV
ncbi:two-component sensor histidine kinase [Paenibacillus sp. 598K]|nr:two-component sensor histidine kinase [Paenibacillus sp. 598K]